MGWVPGLGRIPGECNGSPMFFPGNPMEGPGELYSPWGCKESDLT